MYLLVPFILKKFEKFLELIQGYKDVPFSGPKWPICPEQNFFGTNHYYYFHLPIGIYLIQQNLQKFLQQIQSYEDGPFLGPKWSICPPPQKNFFWKIINIILIYLSAPFIVQNFKKFFQQSQSYEDVQCLGPKWPISPNENFFRKPINEPCFFHSCLSTCQKSKLDIDLLVKY